MEGIDFLREYTNATNFIEVRTSGSTGIPKTIRLSKEILKESARRTNQFFNITSSSRLHSAISDEFIGGKMMIVRSVEANCRLTCEKPSISPLKDNLDMSPIDLLAVVPAQMWQLVDSVYDVPEIRNIIIGGAPIPTNLKTKIIESGLNAWETYGMTETASHIALRKVDATSSPFTVLPEINISLDDRGCLIIETPLQTVTTNDVAELVAENKFLILGRYDNMINTGGKKVNPPEIEGLLNTFTNASFYVTSKADDQWGEKIVIALERNSEGADKFISEWNQIRKDLANHLPAWKIPKEIIEIDQIPITPNGKIKRVKFK